MSNSVNTNVGALVALQNLNATNTELSKTQNRINTGLKIASAKENGAIWAIAQNSRATSTAAPRFPPRGARWRPHRERRSTAPT